jgi:predicted alpha/beta superfamily hydrolase
MVSISVHGQDKMSGVVTYRIGHYETVHSSKLNEERRLLVHLPDDYETSSKKYPVLYVLDGETDLAIKNYKKSLELNPDNEYAKQMLRKLTKKE